MASRFLMYNLDPQPPRARLEFRLGMWCNRERWVSRNLHRKALRLARGPLWLYRNRQAFRRFQAAGWEKLPLRPKWRRVLSRQQPKLRRH